VPHADMKDRQIPVSPHPEVLDQASGSFNALIKQSAERLLPLLGERIHLRSFCATGLSPVVISPTQIEDILGRLFVKAREEMQPGGLVLLQTAHSTNPSGSYPSHVVLTLRYMAGEMDHVQTVVQIAVNANPA
jgi:hypothetical protein